MTKNVNLSGNYYEDFSLGQQFIHGVPRTITEADATLYTALTGSRFALNCALTLSQSCGFKSMPIDNFLVFHIAFGKTVNDISLNAVANLGYAEVSFNHPCYAGDTLAVKSEVIGLKENSNNKTGIVYVRSQATNQNDQLVVSWVRWVMVEKRAPHTTNTQPVIPKLASTVDYQTLALPKQVNFNHWQSSYSDNQIKWCDLSIGQSIFHRDGITINDSDHSLATRLYQNNAKVHFDHYAMQTSRHQQRLVYGGHIISLCRALSYNGLGNAIWPAAINAGTHANPSFAGDTIYAQTEVIDLQKAKDREDVGLARLRLIGIKNDLPDNMPFLMKAENGRTIYHKDVVLELDYWCFILA
ncbi:MaoC family dehydratase [Aliikangiella sp. IMCC44632]